MLFFLEVVLKNVLSALNDLRGDSLDRIDNNAFRFAAYKQYTWWVHNYLGKGVQKVIPSYAIWTIRDRSPSENNYYVPYMESKQDKEHQK